MKNTILTACIVAFLVLCVLWLPSASAAQETVDWQATANAAEQVEQDARWWANSAAATAEYARQQAELSLQATAGAIQSQATATAQAYQMQVTATASSVQATQAALQIECEQAQATQAVLDWERAATATQTAYQTQATRQAVQIIKEKQQANQSERINNAVWLGVFAVALTIAIAGAAFCWRWVELTLGQRRQASAPTWAGVDIIDIEPAPARPAALIPPQTGWRPAYLRPKKGAN